MKTWFLALIMVFVLYFSLTILVACEEEDDDDDDKSDDVADDDSDDDNDDSTDAGTDDSSGSGGCGCKQGVAGSCPSGLQMKMYAQTAREIFDRNPELKTTAYDILIKQGVIESLPDWMQTLALDVFSDYEIEPDTASSARYEALYKCGYTLMNQEGAELSPSAAANIGDACVAGCLDEYTGCEQMAACVDGCL